MLPFYKYYHCPATQRQIRARKNDTFGAQGPIGDWMGVDGKPLPLNDTFPNLDEDDDVIDEDFADEEPPAPEFLGEQLDEVPIHGSPHLRAQGVPNNRTTSNISSDLLDSHSDEEEDELYHARHDNHTAPMRSHVDVSSVDTGSTSSFAFRVSTNPTQTNEVRELSPDTQFMGFSVPMSSSRISEVMTPIFSQPTNIISTIRAPIDLIPDNATLNTEFGMSFEHSDIVMTPRPRTRPLTRSQIHLHAGTSSELTRRARGKRPATSSTDDSTSMSESDE
jgi:hypothetical protein